VAVQTCRKKIQEEEEERIDLGYVCVYVWKYIYMYVYVCVCMYVCAFTGLCWRKKKKEMWSILWDRTMKIRHS
jgi:hypothetical protein